MVAWSTPTPLATNSPTFTDTHCHPTATSTATFTSTATSTATQTRTSTPTATFTSTSTGTQTPTVSPTFTLIPTATSSPTPTISPVPTAIPTPAPTQPANGFAFTLTITDDTGTPVPRALVIIQGIGTFITDDNGLVVIILPKDQEGTAFTVKAIKLGFAIPDAVVTVGDLSTATLQAARSPYPASCVARDITAERATLDASFISLYEFQRKLLVRLQAQQGTAKPQVAAGITRALNQLALKTEKVQDLSARKLPSAILWCPPSELSCELKSLSDVRVRYRRYVKGSFKTFGSVLNWLEKVRVVDKTFVADFSREARLQRNATLGRLDRISLATLVCK